MRYERKRLPVTKVKGLLYNDSSIITKNLSTFKFSMIGNAVLSWEAQIGSGWIGGAEEVNTASGK
jgi:hypothetical protein